MWPKKKKVSGVSVQLEKHQAERRRGMGGYLLCGGGCCCCSCCLHSLGGLIGAAVVSGKSKSATGGSVVACYWTILTVLTVVVSLWGFASAEGFGIIGVLLFLPLVQLAASVVTLLWVQIRSADFSDKQTDLRTLGRITLWSLLGAVVGLIAMILGFMMMTK